MGVSVSVIAASNRAGSTPPGPEEGPDSMVARMMSKVVRIIS